MPAAHAFRHEALLYDGPEEFADRTAAFVRGGLEADEPVLVMVGARKIELLRDALGADADEVALVDMEVAGRNPSRIIPAWRDFADRNGAPGRGLRGVGEPIWAERSPAELVECQTHESLINPAFSDAENFTLVCPYDIGALPDDVIIEALRSHPDLYCGPRSRPSPSYDAVAATVAGLDKPLPEAPEASRRLGFRIETLHAVRQLVASEADAAGIPTTRRDDLVLAVSEIGANSVRHGGGEGTLRVWPEGDGVVCEVRDAGHIDDALAGRVSPELMAGSGQGIWLANNLCDLVQIRSFPDGVTVRLHQSR